MGQFTTWCRRCIGRGWVHRLRVGSIPARQPGTMLIVPLEYARERSVKDTCPHCCGTGRVLPDYSRKDVRNDRRKK